MNEKTIYNRVSKDRQTGRMKTPEMLYQQLDRITDYRFCKRDKYTEEEIKSMEKFNKIMQDEIVQKRLAELERESGDK